MSGGPFGGGRFFDPQSEANRLLDEALANLGRAGSRRQGAQPTQWFPTLDVLHEGGDLLIWAELSGVGLEDVGITLHERVLTISGERKAEGQGKVSGYLVRERRQGAFRRSVVLPRGVEEGGISARLEGGVLELGVPGSAADRAPKRIRIGGPGVEGGEQ